MKRFPLIPSIFVGLAVATMVALGFWQLGRMGEKEALLSAYAEASEQTELAAFPFAGEGQEVWFRRSAVDCAQVLGIEPVAGTSATGQKGWTHRASCAIGDAAVFVDLGFSRSLEVPSWEGGEVSGIIAPGPRLVADPAQAGLEPLAKPDPSDLPNNHLAYAGQWFFFALTALLIYGFALRSRMRRQN